MGKIWDKGFDNDALIDSFTVGKDRELDLLLAPYDILGSIAHTTMLEKVGLLSAEDLAAILPELRKLYKDASEGNFHIDGDVEDVHSQVEAELTRRIGEAGKKIHTGRSRNDQVLVDLKLFSRAGMQKTAEKVQKLFRLLQAKSEQYKDVLMPGYTHLQVAMPSSFGLWFGAYAESLTADMAQLLAAWEVTNRNPLGSAAGYGSSAPLDRSLTTRLLGFADLDYNSVYAQMSRGKTERIIASAYASVAETLGRLATDCCLYSSQNFAFIHLPDKMTTGSSIMPHKKNPDVFELIRSHCNRICGVQNSLRLMMTNLPSGYFRDCQLLKEEFLPMFGEMDDCLDIACYAVENMEVETHIMEDRRYRLAFTVEEVNRLVNEGMPFRDAYRQVGKSVQAGEFEYCGQLHHTHEGSIGNLCNDKVAERMDKLMSRFGFDLVNEAVHRLTGSSAAQV